ncbi:MAG: aminotransferase class III-fold pyridoxal phosphate-dependent enzyme [Planctomycetia bacterium]|nr:aminotransferase class III-fold pyridoxal phosphate-dependent enzyme [Planctomycetia bacterium]
MNLPNSSIVATYLSRTPKSARLAAEAQGIFPSGITHDGRYLKPYGIYVDRARGSRKWDADGHEYADYSGGHGALLLGHNHPAVTEAVRRQIERGTHFGACHELEVRWGEWVQKLVPSAERVRFTSSGTEATMLAMRLARASTGRTKVMHFMGHFHGWHDHVAFGVSSHFDGTPTPGVLAGVAHSIVMAPPGDAAETRRLMERHAADLAAVIVEPTGASWGQVPLPQDFLPALRQMTAKHGVVLIFDEVISGFRCAPGGAQQVFAIRPDLTTLAKIIAGGLPGGAIVGRADIMEGLSFPEGKPQREKISHHGTFNANPLSAAAGIAALEIVGTTDACDRASRYAAQLRDALNEVLREEGVGWIAYGSFSGFHILMNPPADATPEKINAGAYGFETFKTGRDPVLINLLRLGMLNEGVDLFSWPGGPTSAVHTGDDLVRTVEAFRGTLRILKREGHIGATRRAPVGA